MNNESVRILIIGYEISLPVLWEELNTLRRRRINTDRWKHVKEKTPLMLPVNLCHLTFFCLIVTSPCGHIPETLSLAKYLPVLTCIFRWQIHCQLILSITFLSCFLVLFLSYLYLLVLIINYGILGEFFLQFFLIWKIKTMRKSSAKYKVSGHDFVNNKI